MADERTTSSRARPLLAALACSGIVFAAASSCGEGAVHYTAGGGDGGAVGGGGSVPLDGGDGGLDGGDAGLDGGDAGLDGGDGGCVDAGQVAFVTDNCFSSSGGQVSMAYLPNGCSVSMTWSGVACTGILSGSNDAFDGGCQGAGGTRHCTGTAFPGPLTCTGGPQPCTLLFCINPSCAP